MFTFFSWLFGYEEKRIDKKTMVNFKFYDVPDCTADNYKTHIAQYLKKKRTYNKNKLYNISDGWSRDMLNLDFL